MRRAKSGNSNFGGSGLSRLLLTHFKIVKEESRQMVALYVSEVGYRKRKGTLSLAAGMGDALRIPCVLGVAS